MMVPGTEKLPWWLKALYAVDEYVLHPLHGTPVVGHVLGYGLIRICVGLETLAEKYDPYPPSDGSHA